MSLRGHVLTLKCIVSAYGVKRAKCFFFWLFFQKYVESSLGWAGERGEDSSYDSECDDEGAHRTASRTPSDTLAAEFAEYVTLTPTPAQPNQVRCVYQPVSLFD